MPADHRDRPEGDAVAFEPGGSALRLLACRVAERPDHPFLWVQERGPWTLGGLASATAALAVELTAAGLQPGDRTLIRLGNDARFLPALAATWSVGASAVVMHPAAPTAEVDRVADTFGVRCVMVADDEDRAEEPVAGGRAVVLVSEPGLFSPGEALELTVPDVGAHEDALVLLTSGSTGEPKGVVLSHAAVWANIKATVSAFRSDTRPTPIPAGPKPPTLITNPLSHTAGIVRILFALYVGRSIVLLRKFDARAAHATVLRHSIDHLTLNPAMLRMLLDTLEPGERLGKVRYVGSGTAPLPPALREEFEARFGVPVLGAYGQTEAFGGIAVENVRDVLAGNRRPGSVGRPLKGVEVRIRRPDGTDAGTGAEGEIVARTPSVTTGYLGAADVASPIDRDGWLHTGDLGHLDADGYLFVTGRLKNVIICGGFNVIPEEVEARLMDDPAVRVAAVVPVPDDRLGEIPVALVESDDPAADILSRVADRLAAYKRPRRLFTVEALPRVANGKVDQPAARRLAAELVASADDLTDPSLERRITAIAFDMGGVLTHSALGGLDRFAAELGLPSGSISGFFRGDARMASVEVGQMSARDFFKYVCVELEARHGQRIDIGRLAAAAEEGQVLNPEMIETVRRLHQGFTTALVTNNVAEASWRATFPFDLFDVVVDSSAVGVRKPDPRFYQELLRRLDRPASEVVFVDDFEENLTPATELGMATVHFTGIKAFRLALAELGVAAAISEKERSTS
ncbi:MAG TPA: HAD-IA family hydrolase [Acidimicrobiia bacterium]|nr:HAD-IA family hydrolase [Acidimicrobiia bacterium]